MSNPSLSFGSNHVDFGGMIAPASETAISSSTPTGVEGERNRRLTGVHQVLQF